MTQHIYFLGIGGTLMGNLAILAKQAGYQVTGSDKVIYPPMSDQLAAHEIITYEGFSPTQLIPKPDMVVIGNAGLPRGHEAVEYVLDNNLPYTSGAQWLGETLLRDRWVLAVSGTHGKTTGSTMLAHILRDAGLDPGYLIGGVPLGFKNSAHLGTTPFFVLEADEYDTSYFDRQSKFLHYRPRTLVINNLEFDHADIFKDLSAIQYQFHHLIRAVPGNGLIVAPSHDDNVNELLSQGCWSELSRFGVGSSISKVVGDQWLATPTKGGFEVSLNQDSCGMVNWSLFGEHNINNGLAALAAARHVGVPVKVGIEALSNFAGVKRRLELIAEIGETKIYDDFAHHPTAIRATLQGLRDFVGNDQIIAIIEPRTHTMSLGTFRQELSNCCSAADQVYWFRGENIRWDINEVVNACVVPAYSEDNIERLIKSVTRNLPDKPSHVVIMSNGSFGDIYSKLPEALSKRIVD